MGVHVEVEAPRKKNENFDYTSLHWPGVDWSCTPLLARRERAPLLVEGDLLVLAGARAVERDLVGAGPA